MRSLAFFIVCLFCFSPSSFAEFNLVCSYADNDRKIGIETNEVGFQLSFTENDEISDSRTCLDLSPKGMPVWHLVCKDSDDLMQTFVISLNSGGCYEFHTVIGTDTHGVLTWTKNHVANLTCHGKALLSSHSDL